MKRDINTDQLDLFEPSSETILQCMQAHARNFERATDLADLMDVCLLPGARDVAEREAAKHYEAWLHCALFLDLEREAG